MNDNEKVRIMGCTHGRILLSAISLLVVTSCD